jgi:hypothetical protein
MIATTRESNVVVLWWWGPVAFNPNYLLSERWETNLDYLVDFKGAHEPINGRLRSLFDSSRRSQPSSKSISLSFWVRGVNFCVYRHGKTDNDSRRECSLSESWNRSRVSDAIADHVGSVSSRVWLRLGTKLMMRMRRRVRWWCPSRETLALLPARNGHVDCNSRRRVMWRWSVSVNPAFTTHSKPINYGFMTHKKTESVENNSQYPMQT